MNNHNLQKTCPRCANQPIVPIVYGMPGPELIERASRGEVALGGCCVTGEYDNKYACLSCGHRWGAAKHLPGAKNYDMKQLTQAGALSVVAQLFRDYDLSRDYRILELHPGGGQSYAAHLLIPGERISRANTAVWFGIDKICIREIEEADFAELLRDHKKRGEIVARIAKSIGAERRNREEALSAPGVMYNVLAFLAEDALNSHSAVTLKCAWHDSSGMEGCAIDDNATLFKTDGEMSPVEALDYWIVTGSHADEDGQQTAVVCVNGEALKVEASEARIDLYGAYLAGPNRFRPALDLIREMTEY